jgi:hypothetical protein
MPVPPNDGPRPAPVNDGRVLSVPSQLRERRHVVVAGENPWQQRARLMQALWREERGYPIGLRGGDGPLGADPLGTRLAMPAAQQQLWNFLTPTIGRHVVKAVANKVKDCAVIQEPRIWEDLLSSQPLCFNLFAELADDLAIATEALGHLWPSRIGEVTKIRFEYSPGRLNPRYLNNRSAADVFIEHTTPTGGRSFIAIEVKYHEDLSGRKNKHQPRYDEVADLANLFEPDAYDDLRCLPLQQMWLDHLLALVIRQTHPELESPLWVFAYPAANDKCRDAASRYATTLKDRSTYEACTLERLLGDLTETVPAAWPSALHDRYLNPERLSSLGIPG